MTIYTRKYPDFGGMTSVLILTYEDTGMLSGCLLDYAASGKLTGIHPGEKISPGELERSWTMMEERCDRHDVITNPPAEWAGGCKHMDDGRVCGSCMGGLVG